MAIYYVSANGCDENDGLTVNTPWRSIKKINESIKGGDTVRFRCGDTFFGQVLPPKKNDSSEPTTYTSYGEGQKPTLSQYKTALRGSWEKSGDGVWRMDLTDISKFEGNITELDTNVGFIKTDGVIRAKKCFELGKLEEQWDFYNDGRYIYVSSYADPSLLAQDIKLACNIICMRFADGIAVEGISFIGSGAHGISGTVNGATVRGCEFHELGGSELLTYHESGVRYGNGLECWTDSSEVLVEGCRFSGIYDVAMTMQGDNASFGWKNITFRNNIVWNCQQAFEIWSGDATEGVGFKNCVFENNVCIDSGYCWGYGVRPNKKVSCHLLMYSLECPLCDVSVRNNIFYSARVSPIYKSVSPDKLPANYIIEGNTFFVDQDQDIIFRHNCTDEVYRDIFDRLSAKNSIVIRKF